MCFLGGLQKGQCWAITPFMAHAADLEKLLAGTQCTECGFDGCAPYAQALANGQAEINLCKPGGERVVAALAEALKKPIIAPAKPQEPLKQVVVDEANCIGCTLCIQNCPVDCIVGAPKMAHTIVADACTGCGLCVPVCPVDCMIFSPHPKENAWQSLKPTQRHAAEEEFAAATHARVAARKSRLDGLAQKKLKGAKRTAVPKQVAPQGGQTVKGENLAQKLPQEMLEKIAKARAQSRAKYSKK